MQPNQMNFNDPSGRPFVPPQSRGNYKTELCKFYLNGTCPYNQKCSFAHGQQELKEKQFTSSGSS
jgi:hypothetical protein